MRAERYTDITYKHIYRDTDSQTDRQTRLTRPDSFKDLGAYTSHLLTYLLT